MSQYDEELMHYGIPGMKWGHRKAVLPQVSQSSTNKKVANAAQAKQNMKAAKKAYKSANKAFNKAYRNSNSWILNSQFDKADYKKRQDVSLQAAQKAEKSKQAYKKAKANYKMSDKIAKKSIKDVKKQYRKQYMAGESIVGKIYGKVTDADKIYADMQYELHRK